MHLHAILFDRFLLFFVCLYIFMLKKVLYDPQMYTWDGSLSYKKHKTKLNFKVKNYVFYLKKNIIK